MTKTAVKNTSRPCWICGKKADSGEHTTKKTDLKHLGSGPYRYNSSQKRNKIIGPNSKIIKSYTICATCNNQLSQPYDKAWETLSAYLQSSNCTIAPQKSIELHKIFPGKIHASMLYVHLFFVKLFGCRIADANIPINLKNFSASILKEKAHPNIYLTFCPPITGCLGSTDIWIENPRQPVFAVWYYELPKFSVRVMYATPGQQRQGLEAAWHPSTLTTIIKFGSI